MNDKELQATREIYNNFEQERNQIGVARKKLYELEQNPLIQEYLKLKKFIEDYQMDKYTDKNVSKHIYESIIIDTKSSNNIYVYIGRDANRKILDTYYHLYKDLETGRKMMILESQRDQFERSNKVIYMLPKTGFYSKETWLRKYNEIRELFLSYVIKQPQEQAVKKLMHKYSKNYR